ncbi:MAG: LysM peptidoglycan-binding domain-containing protein [Bacteroidota bacterium]
MRSVFILCSILPFISFGLPIDSIRSEQRADGLFIIHEVEENETLYSIARRYKSSVQSIVAYNEIEDSRIEIGQKLEVLYGLVSEQKTEVSLNEGYPLNEGYHTVVGGETLYSISKKYDMKVRDLRTLNDLKGNAISPGQVLIVSSEGNKEDLPTKSKEVASETTATDETSQENDFSHTRKLQDQFKSLDFESYWVQAGETLASIAEKIGVTVDQLMDWNNMKSALLKKGQEIKFIKEMRQQDPVAKPEETKDTKSQMSGPDRIQEEGVAAEITDIQTTKYLALHRALPIGTELAVRNLMNDLVVYVKVVGKLPDTGLNENIMLRLSPPAYKQLRILDPKTRVEVSYHK